jgi:phosphoenolpyruvate phosphomutase
VITQSQPGIQVANGPRVADRLRNLICLNHESSFQMEAHDGLSAAAAERADFKGLWPSGLSISCSPGYRDACETSWIQLVNIVERMADVTELPVLVDGDSALGSFSNARLPAPKLLPRGAGGVAFEEWTKFHVNSRK